WCPALNTVLANEEVHDGKYVETGDPVEKRLLTQWMLKITEYADRLSEEFEIVGERRDGDRAQRIMVFTTRPDTLFGGTWVVLAPEHPLVDAITTPEQRAAVAAYRAETGKRSERDRVTEAADA